MLQMFEQASRDETKTTSLKHPRPTTTVTFPQASRLPARQNTGALPPKTLCNRLQYAARSFTSREDSMLLSGSHHRSASTRAVAALPGDIA
jgi:hypothetical protein